MPSIRRSTTAIASWRSSSVPEMFELFDEYAAAYARGERPRAREYLTRAGPQADELAGLIDQFLQRSPAAEPDVKKEQKVEGYYHQLEGGLLEPRGVDQRVWEALAQTFKTRVDDLVAWRPR